MPLEFTTGPFDGRSDQSEVVLVGRLYGDAVPALHEALERPLADGLRLLVVNAAGLEQIDAAGVALFLEIVRRLHPRDGAVVFYGLRPVVDRMLALTGADRVVGVVPTRAEALARLAS